MTSRRMSMVQPYQHGIRVVPDRPHEVRHRRGTMAETHHCTVSSNDAKAEPVPETRGADNVPRQPQKSFLTNPYVVLDKPKRANKIAWPNPANTSRSKFIVQQNFLIFFNE